MGQNLYLIIFFHGLWKGLKIAFITYLKNGWENDFNDRWSHLSDLSDVATPLSTSTSDEEMASTLFPVLMMWTSLERSKDDMPNFTIQNMMNYFVERLARDNEKNKDYKNLNSKVFGLFKHGHVQKIKVSRDVDSNLMCFHCHCLPEMKKNVRYNLSCFRIERRGDNLCFLLFMSSR